MSTSARSRLTSRPAVLLTAVAIAFIFLFVALTVAAKPSAPDSAIVYLRGPEGPINVGDEITVTIGISDVIDMYGTHITLGFNPEELQVVDADGGKPGIQITTGECPVPDFILLNTADNAAGSIQYATAQLSPTLPVSGDCDMAYIRFQTTQIATTVITITDLLISDPNGQLITTTVNGLTLEILPPPPAAEFTGSPSSGIAPLQVDFLNLSTGDFDTCAWDFGDGGLSSNDCNDPSHDYVSAGVYSVSLTVSGLGGSDTETAADYIAVYEPVMADFSGSPTTGIAPHLVDFVDMSTGDYDTCAWDFGDGNTSTNCANPSNNYTSGGVFAVSLTVSGLGGTDTETKTDYIMVTVYYSYIPIIIKPS